MALTSESRAEPRNLLADLLDEAAEEVALPARDTFMIEGEPASWLWRLDAGTVRLIKLMADGRQQIVGFPPVGDWIGLSAEGRYCASAETTTRGRLQRVRRSVLDRVLEEHPALQRDINDRLALALAEARDQIVLLGRMSARERLVHFLVDRARGTPDAPLPPPGTSIELPMIRGDIADYLGLTIETTSRLFSRLRGEGLIDWRGRHTLILLDPDRLAGEAH